MHDIIRKLRFKDNGIILNAPTEIEDAFVDLGFTTSFNNKNKSIHTLAFIRNGKEFSYFLNNQLANVEPDSVLWFAYPKSTSKIKTDINRDTIRETGEKFGITTVTAISIDDTWSALRFRPINRVGK